MRSGSPPYPYSQEMKGLQVGVLQDDGLVFLWRVLQEPPAHNNYMPLTCAYYNKERRLARAPMPLRLRVQNRG